MKEGRNPWFASQLPAIPYAEGMTFHPIKVSDRRLDFHKRLAKLPNLFTLKAYRLTFKQHRISAILDLARSNNLKTSAAHFLSEPVEDSGIDGRLCQAHPFL